MCDASVNDVSSELTGSNFNMKNILPLCAMLALLAGCSASSGPTFSAYSVNIPGQEGAYRVECGGLFESSKTCMKVAARICADKPVHLIETLDRVSAQQGSTPDPRVVTFRCGEPQMTQAPAPVVAAPAALTPVPPPPSQIKLSGDAQFAVDQATLTPAARSKLDALLASASGYTFQTVAVRGYTDSTGARAHNVLLSQRRAEAVMDYLRQHGLKALNIVAQGYGPDNPVASNATAQGRMENRRVEIELHQMGPDAAQTQ